MEQEINQNNIEKIIKNFNEDFNANVSIKNTTLLKNIFQNFVNINMSSMISNETDIKIIELEEKIKKTLDKDSNLLEEWKKIQDNYMLNVTEQAYIYGLCTYKQLNSEIDGLNERKDNEEEQQILKHFDKIFGTKVANHIKLNIPLLKNIFEKFEEDIFKPSEKYDMLRKEQIKIADELYPTFTEKQNKLFEQYWQVTNQLNSIEDEQLFYFGFIMAKEIEKESKIEQE